MKGKQIFKLKYILKKYVYFNFLNSNGSIFYTLIKVIIHYMNKIMQRTKSKQIILKI